MKESEVKKTVAKKPLGLPSISAALDQVPDTFKGTTSASKDEGDVSLMKYSKKENEMRSHIKGELHSGQNQYRFTEPPKLAVNVFANKRTREQADLSDEDDFKSASYA